MKIFEILFLLCFAVSWPISIAKALRTHEVKGKSPIFMVLIILGYIFGILNKFFNPDAKLDYVTWLYAMNMLLVSWDLLLYFKYSKKS